MDTNNKTEQKLTWKKVNCPDLKFGFGHASVIFNHYIIVIGITNNIGIFNIKEETWHEIKPTGDILLTRKGHSACLFDNNKIIVFGGCKEHTIQIMTITESEFLEINCRSINYSENGAFSKSYHTAHVHENKMYVCGGFSKHIATKMGLLCLNLDTFQWNVCQLSGDKIENIFNQTSALFRGRIYIFGDPLTVSTLHIIDIADMSCRNIAVFGEKLPQRIFRQFGARVSEELIYQFIQIKEDDQKINCLFAYDIKTNSWRVIEPTWKVLTPIGSTVCYKNRLYVLVGEYATATCDIYYLQPNNEKQSNDQEAKSKKVNQVLRKMFLEKTFADVSFHVENEKFDAHRSVLSIRSKFFENLFTNGMKENCTNIIEIPDMKANTFKGILEYIYCDKIEELNENLAYELLEQSNKYCLPELKKDCEKFLTKCLTKNNLREMTRKADLFDAMLLKENISEFISENMIGMNLEDVLDDIPKHILIKSLGKLAK